MFDQIKDMVLKGYGVYEARDLLGISEGDYSKLPSKQRKELMKLRINKPRVGHPQGQPEIFIRKAF